MGDDKTAPAFEVYDSGSKIGDALKARILQITVDDRVDQAAVAMIELSDEKDEVSGGKAFKVGNELKIELGYVGKTAVVFEGEVTGSKGTYPRRGPATFTVVGMDKFHRLRRNRRVETYLKMKDSDVASQVAGKAGLSCDAEATSLKLDYICQQNQTDADFLLERAKLYGYEVWVDGKTLKFRKPKLDEGAASKIKWHEQLKHLSTTISLLRAQEVKVSAWNMKDKKGVSHSAKKGDELSLMGSTKAGNEVLSGKFGAPVLERPFFPASAEDEVTEFAKGAFHERSQQFVTGNGMCAGDPKIRRGKVVEIDGIGDELSGCYYVHCAIHTMLPKSGYTTTFRVMKTAVKKGTPPPAKNAPPSQTSSSSKSSPPPPEPKQDLTFVSSNDAGKPLAGTPYLMRNPDGTTKSGTVPPDGKVQVQKAPPGSHTLELEHFGEPKISQDGG
jgi:phage protein D